MNPQAMETYGDALLAYHRGDHTAEQIILRDDGLEDRLPVSYFFRNPMSAPIDKLAIEHCRGRVLDAGAGTGIHSLALQARGHQVTAIDVCATAVELMRRRGVTDPFCADLLTFQGGKYDTILMLGHGIGMVETLAGLDSLLALAPRLLTDGGQIILDSTDVRVSTDPRHVAYREANERSGRYAGEIRLQFEFAGRRGSWCGWLHVDFGTLEQHAGAVGWTCQRIHEEEGGDYLAQLRRQG